MTTKKKPEFRLFDFQVDNTTYDEWNDEQGQDNKKFLIKMFAMNGKGKTYCIYVKGFTPFFYVLVPDNWEKKDVVNFKQYLKMEVGQHYENSILNCEIVKKKKLYGFDNFKDYKFVKVSFKNHTVFNKAKKLWYTNSKNFKNSPSPIALIFPLCSLPKTFPTPLISISLKAISLPAPKY